MANSDAGEEPNGNYTHKASHIDQRVKLDKGIVTTGLENKVTSCWKVRSEDKGLLQLSQACPGWGDGPQPRLRHAMQWHVSSHAHNSPIFVSVKTACGQGNETFDSASVL